MRALAGLGNPGDEHAQQRHNAGWMLLAALERRHPVVDSKELSSARLSRIRMKGRREDGGPAELWLIRSRTFMNDSGRGVSQATRELRLEPHDVVVAFDDIDLPLGKVRLRESGGAGGQKGMRSVIEALGTQKIPRLRLGICGARATVDTADYVLSRFDKDERDTVAEMVEEAADAVEMVLRAGFATAMNRYN